MCDQDKELSEYYSQKRKNKDGTEWIYYNPECKVCTKERSKKWVENNYDKFLASQQRYVQKPESKILRRKKSRRRKEEGKYLEWQRNNPDKIKEYNKDRTLHKKHKISTREWEDCKRYFNHRCAYCGLAIEDHWIQFAGKNQLGDFHKEHVYDDGTNDLSNCIPSCKECNTSKHTDPFFEWYSSDNEHFEEERFFKILKWLTEDYKLYIKNKS
jgi:hypothetical protein